VGRPLAARYYWLPVDQPRGTHRGAAAHHLLRLLHVKSFSCLVLFCCSPFAACASLFDVKISYTAAEFSPQFSELLAGLHYYKNHF
jgi:hypothetical protein